MHPVQRCKKRFKRKIKTMATMIRARCSLKSVAAFRCVDGSFEGSLNTLCISFSGVFSATLCFVSQQSCNFVLDAFYPDVTSDVSPKGSEFSKL